MEVNTLRNGDGGQYDGDSQYDDDSQNDDNSQYDDDDVVIIALQEPLF